MAIDQCPRCGAARDKTMDELCNAWQDDPPRTHFACWTGIDMASGDVYQSSVCKLNQIEQLCRKYDHPGVNLGGQAIAYKVLRIIEGGEQ